MPMADSNATIRYDIGTPAFAAWQNISSNVTYQTTLSNVTNTTETPFDKPPDPPYYQTWQQVIISLILIFIICGTIVGNSLVCIAVALVRRLRTPSNLLIVSLAVSDLLVGLLVMPFAISYEILQEWVLGPTVCDMWTSLDVLLCTASILNLCMISVDRYFVITRPFQYAMKRTPKRMGLMITAVWVMSALISIPPLFGWKPEQQLRNQCGYSQELGYQIYATLGAFYLPLTVMIIVYYRIWRVSSRIAKQERKSSNIGSLDKQRPADTLLLPRPSKSSKGSVDSTFLPNGSLRNGGNDKDDDNHTHEILPKKSHTGRRFTIKQLLGRNNHGQKSTVSSKDRKATKTLGVIMGGFTLCWLPFFILAVVRPFCGEACLIPQWLSSIFLWLGYANSFCNPVIYARFNREFRTPFREILCCRCTRINVRLNTESYNDMYGKGVEHTIRDSLKPPKSTTVRYDSQGQTVVQLGNGSANSEGETKI